MQITFILPAPTVKINIQHIFLLPGFEELTLMPVGDIQLPISKNQMQWGDQIASKKREQTDN